MLQLCYFARDVTLYIAQLGVKFESTTFFCNEECPRDISSDLCKRRPMPYIHINLTENDW